MTIPIVPGPFSFIENLGEAGGRFLQANEQKRRFEQDKARQMMESMYAGVREGALKADILKSDFFANLIQQSGFPNFPGAQVADKPQDLINTGQTGFIQELIAPGEKTEEQATSRETLLRTGKVPSKSEALAEGAAVKAQEAGGAAGRAVSRVPTEQVATAIEAGPVGAAFADAAPGYVALATQGKNSSFLRQNFQKMVDAAYQQYVQEQAAGNQPLLPESMAKSRIASALQTHIGQLVTEEVQRERVSRDGADTRVRDLNIQHDNVSAQIQSLQAQINQLSRDLPDPILRQFDPEAQKKVEKISTLEARIKELELNRTDIQNKLSDVVVGGSGEQGGQVSEDLRIWQADVEFARKMWADGIAAGGRPRFISGKPPLPKETVQEYITRVLPRP
jgi:chaperonin cofactor prefoldin